MSEPRRGMAFDGVPAEAVPGRPTLQPGRRYGYVDWRRYRQLCEECSVDYGDLRIQLDGVDVTFACVRFNDLEGWADINVPQQTHTDVERRFGDVRLLGKA